MRRGSKLQLNSVNKNIALKCGHADFISQYILENIKSGMDMAFIKGKCQFSLYIYVGTLLFPFIFGRLIRCFMYSLKGNMNNISLIMRCSSGVSDVARVSQSTVKIKFKIRGEREQSLSCASTC